MKAVRRSYIYIATLVSLMAVSWALVFLVQNLVTGLDRTALAWQLAVLVIATPLFVSHWLWAERLHRQDAEEQVSLIRRFFLWLVLAAYLGPFLALVFSFVRNTLGLSFYAPMGRRETLLESGIALVILALFWVYFMRILQRDRATQPDTPGQLIIQRLYRWGFNLAGLIMVTIGITEFARWILQSFEGVPPLVRPTLLPEVARLLVGGGAWLFFWLRLQRDFNQNNQAERESVLRKIFLYAILFVGLLIAITNLALMWDGLLLTWLGERVPGELSDTLPLVLSGGLLVLYHWQVLRRDAAAAPFEAQQRLIRHIYQYLTATVGLLATLAGISGLISILILTLYGNPLERSTLAGFIATLTAGLPVWLWPWWRIQQRAGGRQLREAALAESGSIVRRIYLYFFLLIATLTILGSGVYIVFRIFSLIFDLNPSGESSSDLALAVAYALIGLVIWLYHGQLVRLDGRRQDSERAERLSDVHVLVYNNGDPVAAEPLLAAIRQKIPNVDLALFPRGDEEAGAVTLETADIVVASAQMAADAALVSSPAEKVLIPQLGSGWHWAGVEEAERGAVLRDAAEIVEKLALAEGGLERRKWGVGSVIAGLIGGFVLLIILLNIFGAIMSSVF